MQQGKAEEGLVDTGAVLPPSPPASEPEPGQGPGPESSSGGEADPNAETKIEATASPTAEPGEHVPREQPPQLRPPRLRPPRLRPWWRTVTDLVLIFAVLGAVLLPGLFSLPLTDREEAQNAEITREMVSDGVNLVPRYRNEIRADQPAGLYWAETLSVSVFGNADQSALWVYRLPSVLGFVVAVLALWWMGWRMFGATPALISAGLFAVSLLPVAEAHLATAASLLLGLFTVALAAFARMYTAVGDETTPRASFVFWTALGFGVLVNGPLILILIGIPVVLTSAMDLSLATLHRLNPLTGAVWLAVLLLPQILLSAQYQGLQPFVAAIDRDLALRLSSVADGHHWPIGSYFFTAWLTFFPAVGFLPAAVPGIWRELRRRDIRLLISALVPAWLLFEALPMKMPHYVLPLSAPLTLLIAAGISVAAVTPGRALRTSLLVLPLVALIAGFGLNVAFVVLEHRVDPLGLFGAAVLTAIAFAGWWWTRRTGRLVWALVGGVIAGLLLNLVAFAELLPAAYHLFPSDRIAETIAAARPMCPKAPVIAVGFDEPSLVFNLGADIKVLQSADKLANTLNGAACAFVITDDESLAAVNTALQDLHYGKLQGLGDFEARTLDLGGLRHLGVGLATRLIN